MSVDISCGHTHVYGGPQGWDRHPQVPASGRGPSASPVMCLRFYLETMFTSNFKGKSEPLPATGDFSLSCSLLLSHPEGPETVLRSRSPTVNSWAPDAWRRGLVRAQCTSNLSRGEARLFHQVLVPAGS